MELGRAVAGRDVANDADCAGVLGVETEELGQSGADLPFGELVAVLEAWVKDVGWASKDFGTSKIFTVHLGFGEDFKGCEMGGGGWDVIMQPCGV